MKPISRYFSDPQYYFQVNDPYVRNKFKVVLFPFLHRGHWTRITEPVGGRLSYKPPIYDINAPDLYIPFMAFGTYVVLAGFSLGIQGKFSKYVWIYLLSVNEWPMGERFWDCEFGVPHVYKTLFQMGYDAALGLVRWPDHLVLLVGHYSFKTCMLLGQNLAFAINHKAWIGLIKVFEAPLLDIVAYAGYTFTGMCLAVLGKIIWGHSYYALFTWLGNVGVNWLI
ncbi:hypothetical protein FH972_015180 [Carpinus fangiana]|uniref:Uncharacterized protein n=1 Tax=Carpinus fangiana TaxID=176857 RepID=A0A5N6RF71_9ROSI|nr:hypothetical protein FH972_015180 [Carpinus fangiana]